MANKSWGLQGLNKLFKNMQETAKMARKSGSTESIQNISCFCIL